MLSACPGEELPCVPMLSFRKPGIENLVSELRGFHSSFSDCFLRSEPRENFFRYMLGRFSNLDRKSIEPIALHIAGAEVRSMQRFLSDAEWNENRMLEKYQRQVSEDMGDDEGVCLLSEAGFPKKGGDSVGVAKQPCGHLS